jgi:hypothetical protein
LIWPAPMAARIGVGGRATGPNGRNVECRAATGRNCNQAKSLCVQIQLTLVASRNLDSSDGATVTEEASRFSSHSVASCGSST